LRRIAKRFDCQIARDRIDTVFEQECGIRAESTVTYRQPRAIRSMPDELDAVHQHPAMSPGVYGHGVDVSGRQPLLGEARRIGCSRLRHLCIVLTMKIAGYGRVQRPTA
jgi:hypothetical protein